MWPWKQAQAGGELSRRLKVDQLSSGSFSESGTVNPTMTTHPAISSETYREKVLRKFKQQPLVPVGAPL